MVAMVVAMVGLVGCTESKSTTSGDWDDPSVIAYIGDAVAITEAEVDAVIEDVRAEISEEIEQGLAEAEEKLTAEELASGASSVRAAGAAAGGQPLPDHGDVILTEAVRCIRGQRARGAGAGFGVRRVSCLR